MDFVYNVMPSRSSPVPSGEPSPVPEKDAPGGPSFQQMMAEKRQAAREQDAGGQTEAAGSGAERPADGGHAADEEETIPSVNAQMLLAALAAAQLTGTAADIPQEAEMPPQAAAVPATLGQPAEAGQSAGRAQPLQTAAAPEAQAGEAEAQERTGAERAPAPQLQAAARPAERREPPEGGIGGRDTRELPAQGGPGAGDKTHTVTEAEAAPQPLFKEVAAAPIKVGSGPEPEPAGEAEPVERQVLREVSAALERGESHVKVSLQPERLGSVTVELTRGADGALRVLLHADSARTLSLLERSAAGLQHMLADGAQGTVQVQVERQQAEQPGQQHPYDQNSGQGGQRQQEQPGRHQRQQEADFLQQLRLGLVSMEGEAS